MAMCGKTLLKFWGHHFAIDVFIFHAHNIWEYFLSQLKKKSRAWLVRDFAGIVSCDLKRTVVRCDHSWGCKWTNVKGQKCWKWFVTISLKMWDVFIFLSSHPKYFITVIPVASHFCCFSLNGMCRACSKPVYWSWKQLLYSKKYRKKGSDYSGVDTKKWDVVTDGCICEAERSQKESGRRQGNCTSQVWKHDQNTFSLVSPTLD